MKNLKSVKGNQKGFSLMELIIVIAVMAILVAIMAPILIRWIEKSNVSSDTQLADTVRGAFLCAITDAKVLADPASTTFILQLEDPAGMDADDPSFLASTCVMKESVTEILGISPADLTGRLKSKHEATSKINVKVVGSNVVVTITGTDSTGKKQPSMGRNIVVD